MNRTGYRLVGLLAWRGAKWYVRRVYLSRLPSARTIALAGAGGLLASGAAVALARRAAQS